MTQVQKEFSEQINKAAIKVPVSFFEFFGSLKVAVFVAYILERVSQNKPSINDKEIMQATTLSEAEIRSIKNTLKKHYKFITISKKGLSAVTTYDIDYQNMQQAFSEWFKGIR